MGDMQSANAETPYLIEELGDVAHSSRDIAAGALYVQKEVLSAVPSSESHP